MFLESGPDLQAYIEGTWVEPESTLMMQFKDVSVPFFNGQVLKYRASQT